MTQFGHAVPNVPNTRDVPLARLIGNVKKRFVFWNVDRYDVTFSLETASKPDRDYNWLDYLGSDRGLRDPEPENALAPNYLFNVHCSRPKTNSELFSSS